MRNAIHDSWREMNVKLKLDYSRIPLPLPGSSRLEARKRRPVQGTLLLSSGGAITLQH